MTNIGIAPCLDQVHVYINIGYFATALRIAKALQQQYPADPTSTELRIEYGMDDGWMDYSCTVVSDLPGYTIRIHDPKAETERVL
jgi:hypothetical protein